MENFTTLCGQNFIGVFRVLDKNHIKIVSSCHVRESFFNCQQTVSIWSHILIFTEWHFSSQICLTTLSPKNRNYNYCEFVITVIDFLCFNFFPKSPRSYCLSKSSGENIIALREINVKDYKQSDTAPLLSLIRSVSLYVCVSAWVVRGINVVKLYW